MKTKTILFSDTHLKQERAEKIIKAECPDQIIFQGDYFDDFCDSVHDNRQAAEWLKWSLAQPNRIHIKGNHDSNYGSDNHFTRCSGFTIGKCAAIRDVMEEKDWRKLRFHYWLGDILVTHAGLHPWWLKEQDCEIKDLKEFLIKEEKEAWRCYYSNRPHWFYAIGMARSGYSPYGGLTWCDFHDEFQPISGVSQICGHTFRKFPRVIVSATNNLIEEAPVNMPIIEFGGLCLDTGMNHYAIWDGKNITVKAYADL